MSHLISVACRASEKICLNSKSVVIAVLLASTATNALAVGTNGTPYNGVIPGAFNVSPTGAATYSIPIETPPGIGGITPQLSLNYNSHSGNGLFGVGWSLGGLSVITRCSSGADDPVDFDSVDNFCLDGQKLISVTTNNCSGGTEYRTEIDSGSLICSYDTAGSGPAWFKVWTKAGQVMEYGNDIAKNSRIEA